MKKRNQPRWMRVGRPDEVHANCLNVQEGIVEASDFDPAMCQDCETDTCKWHPERTGEAPSDDDSVEDADDDAEVEEIDGEDAEPDDAESESDEDEKN